VQDAHHFVSSIFLLLLFHWIIHCLKAISISLLKDQLGQSSNGLKAKPKKESNYYERANYLNNKLECTSYISVATDNNHNVDIANSHVKKRATSNLPHRTCTEFFRLHYMQTEGIHHISTERN
jgi:hypothetical protein